jgi:4-amino-4-deoxy-L-arabinose transferase-like glycosyltransferase
MSGAVIDYAQPAQRPGWADALLAAAVLFALSYGLGNYGLYEPHEAHFAGVGREMLLRGDWVTPHLNGSPYLNKPPLLYWMVAASYALFGINEWAARLPLVLIGFGGVALAWQWARELWGLRAARMAAAILTTSAGWYLFGHQLMIDLLLSVLYFWTLYLLWKALQQPERTQRWAQTYCVLGLAVLAKGPVVLLFYAVTIGLYAILIQRDAKLLWRARPFLAAAMVAAITLPWALMVEVRVPGVIRYMIVNENLNRMMDQRWPPDYSVVKVSPLEFLMVAMIWLAPWCLLIPHVGRFVWARARGGGNSEKIATWVLAFGALVPTVLFLPMPSRLIYYCLPTVAPFAVLAAGWWNRNDDSPSLSGTVLGAILAVAGAAIFSAGFWLPPMLSNIPDLAAAPETLERINTMALLLGTALMAGGVLLLLKRHGGSLALLTTGLAFASVYNERGFGNFEPVRSSKRLVTALNPQLGPEAIWVSEGSKEIGASAGIAYYLGVDARGQARTVLVMEDDKRRPPPAFPPPKPAYLIRHERLNELWESETPVVFVTDFQRSGKDPNDAPLLPENAGAALELAGTGHRRVYANPAAHEKLRAGKAAEDAIPAQ